MTDTLRATNQRAWGLIKAGHIDESLHLLTGPMQKAKGQDPKPRGYADLLALFGFSMSMVQKKRKEGIDLCREAIALDRLNPRHYFLLGKIYIEGSSKKLAYDTFKEGLRIDPEYRPLQQALRSMGVRKRPVVKFLDRDHSINVTLGRIRNTIKPSSK